MDFDKTTVAAVLFAISAIVAAVSAVRAEVFRKVRGLEAAVAFAAAGLFVLFQNTFH